MTFTTPLALLLLLTVPFFIWMGRPRTSYRRRRDLVSLALRLVIVTMLVLGLAGAQLVLAADRLVTVFLIDYSDSMGAANREAARDYVDAALESMGPEDQAAVIVFGADALVEQPLSSERELDRILSTPLTLNTNLAQAIRLGLALYPSGVARRMVILSDGQATVGDAESAARLAAASGVQIDFVAFEREPTPEVLVTDVHTPPVLDEGQTFDLNLTLESTHATPAEVTVMSGGQIMHQQTLDLRQGSQSFVLSLEAGDPGFTDFRVIVAPSGTDTFYQNNALSSFSQVTGAPRVLVVRQDPRDSQALVDALDATGILVDEIEPGGLPTGLQPLGVYESIVLVNVPARQLSPRRMAVLQVYVRDLGGGLVAIGGDQSYGVGGYYDTPLEETLPVEMQIRDQERLPQVALVFAIDRSGSMGTEEASGATHLDLAKEAVIRSIDLLNPMDRVGVVGFDSSAFWVVQIQQAEDPGRLALLVETLSSGGGTDIFAAVDAVADTLPLVDAPVKHMILLSDGHANEAGVLELVRRMFEDAGVTTTVVAIGANYSKWIEELPAATGGRFYATPDVSAIPAIFTAETILASRSYIIEEEIAPVLNAPSEILSGIGQVPLLHGYVATSPKATAQTILVDPIYEDPLLAAWQYGLGRSVAWTSDAAPKWATEWLNWDEFARFWNQAVRWTITEGVSDNVEVVVEQRGDEALVRVDAVDGDERYLNGLDLSARLVDPELGVSTVPLRQVAPGRYEASFVPNTEGAYFVGVVGNVGAVLQEEMPADLQADAQAESVLQTTGWVLSYSPEYRALEADTELLAHLAALTGGGLLDKPGDAFDHNLSAERAPTPLWPWLLVAAVVMLPVDIAVRRLVITRRDLERLRAYFGEWFGGSPAATEVTAAQAERFSQLQEAKRRASDATHPDAAPAAPKPRKPADRPGTLAGPAGRTSVEAPPRPRPAKKPTAPPQAQPDDSSLASRLLKTKKRRPSEEDDAD
jgi:uncharacterized membrane protein/cell division septation protein DedD